MNERSFYWLSQSHLIDFIFFRYIFVFTSDCCFGPLVCLNSIIHYQTAHSSPYFECLLKKLQSDHYSDLGQTASLCCIFTKALKEAVIELMGSCVGLEKGWEEMIPWAAGSSMPVLEHGFHLKTQESPKLEALSSMQMNHCVRLPQYNLSL